MNDPRTDIPVTPEEPWVSSDPDRSIGDVFSSLIGSGKEYAQAEIDKQRLRASILGGAALYAAISVAVAIILVFAAVVALLVGLISALSPALTPAGATAVVVIGALLLAGILGLIAKSRITGALKVLKP